MDKALRFFWIFLIALIFVHYSLKSEDWLSAYTRGCIHETEGQWEDALSAYLDAYQLDPLRGEPLRKMATHYRIEGQNHLAYLFAKEGNSIKQKAFIDEFAPYQFDEELSIAAYYTPFKRAGIEAANRLILKRGVPGEVKQRAYNNITFYAEKLPGARFKNIDIKLPPLHPGSPFHYNQMNPSIQRNKRGYTLICRTVNFLHDHGGYTMIDGSPDLLFKTRNFLVSLSKRFEVESQREIIENFPRYQQHYFQIQGLEDCRLINENAFISTTWGATIEEIPQIVLCKLGEKQENEIAVTDFIPLKGPDPSRCEKNWLPFVKNGHLYFIYSYDPFIILEANPSTGECVSVLEYQPDWDLSNFRGSAAPIAFDEGYLVVIHEVAYRDQRYYLHRFLFLDRDFKIQKASLPFIFQQPGIEYCCGMALDHAGCHLIMPIGINDKEAYLCIVDVETIRDLLKDLPKND